MQKKISEYTNSLLNLDVSGLDIDWGQNTASDIINSMDDGMALALQELNSAKASFEDKMTVQTADIQNQIRTLKNLRKQLQDELAEQTAKFALKSWLGVDLTSPASAQNQAMQLNFLDKNTPESAEAIDEIRRNRMIERRDAYLSTYADAVMLKLRIGKDLDIIEHFAKNTDSMDSISGVIGADTDIKIKTIEALMQYAELIVSELRRQTATEFANLTTYKVKNPDKEITNFNFDDYMYDCSLE